MSKALVIYIAVTLSGLLLGWGFAGQFQEALGNQPSERPAIWMLCFGLGFPASVWLFLRDTLR